MKTYIVSVKKLNNISFVATTAKNKTAAFDKVQEKYNGAKRSSVLLSSVNIDFCSCEKI